jgi:hypothetical protein
LQEHVLSCVIPPEPQLRHFDRDDHRLMV